LQIVKHIIFWVQMKLLARLVLFIFPFSASAQFQIGDDIDGLALDDASGWSVSLSSDGNVVAIGAPTYGTAGVDPGYVRVFENIGGVWTQLGSQIDGEAAGDRSGTSVSLSEDGSIVAIGAPGNNGADEGSFSQAGHVRVYELISGSWIQLGEDIDGEHYGDESGYSVSLSSDGTIVAIGAPFNSDNGEYSGHVRVFEYSDGIWTQIGSDIDGEGTLDACGVSVSLSANGNIVAIGAELNSGNSEFSGHTRVYQNIEGTWIQIGDDIDGETAYSYSGASVSLSADGTIVAIGAPNNDGSGGVGSDYGHVRIFQNTEETWTQIGDDIDGEELGDQSGFRVALSSDGTTVAIGSLRNGMNAGHVRIFQNNSGNWAQLGADIDGEAAGDQSSSGVALSSNGTIVAIGAYLNDGIAFDAGHVRVFDLSSVSTVDAFVQNEVLIYPNPSSDLITIQLNEDDILQKVYLYSSQGQFLKSQDETVFSVSELAIGSYVLEVITDKGRCSKTIVVIGN
jgi:hypothetical protein